VVRSSSDGNALLYVLSVLWTTARFHVMQEWSLIKDSEYVSSSAASGGTSWTTDNVVWSRLPAGRTGGEICRF